MIPHRLFAVNRSCVVLVAYLGAFTALAANSWRPFEAVIRPAPPTVKNSHWARNRIDLFIASEHEGRKLTPRPEATRQVLLRRLYLDLIGITPTPDEQAAFEADHAPDAYEKVVERLLNDPRYGERWGRHWMDIWRYSDWAGWSGGNQIRDSKPHIWRWRDWIIESLNRDQGYDRMMLEMMAADELAPEDPNTLRATGYLVRNFKMLSREQWLEDTVKHTAQAFLGLTVGCAKCHDHVYDPISQKEYYHLRAIFEPHQVRTDRVPGQVDTAKDGVVRVYDVATNAPTYLFIRGDERQRDTNEVIVPGVPRIVSGLGSSVEPNGRLRVQPVPLPEFAAFPDQREFVIRDLIAAGEKAIHAARKQLADLQTNEATSAEKLAEQELNVSLALARQESLLATLAAEKIGNDSAAWKQTAENALAAQRQVAVNEAKLKRHQTQAAERQAQNKLDTLIAEIEAVAAANSGVESAEAPDDERGKAKRKKADEAKKALEAARKKTAEAEKALADAETVIRSPVSTDYKPRQMDAYPERSTGRRLAFAQWLADRRNPLTARVAVNHVWVRHFGRGLVPTPADFGRNGRPPSHPELLDWLACEFMDQQWRFKAMHRLIVTSSTYRMSSTADESNLEIDADNIYLWRMPSRRMEAEIVRDNLLHAAGDLESTMGGPEIDHKLGLSSKRRSVYLRIAAEKEVEFLKIFDGPSVTECYQRQPSVVPQQALALANSQIAIAQAARLAAALSSIADDEQFVGVAFQKILGRSAKAEELRLCLKFLRNKNLLTKTARKREADSPSELIAASHRRVGADGRSRHRENLLLVLFNHNDFITIR